MLSFFLGLTILLAPAGKEVSLEGTFGGLHCALHKMKCKAFHADQGEPIALVVALQKGEIVHVERVPLKIMKRYFLKKVRILGEYFPNAKTIMANRVEVKTPQGYRTVWTLKKSP